MSRRPLGAALPIDERAAALEERVREFQAVVDWLGRSLYALDTGLDADDLSPVDPEAAWRFLRAAAVDLLELRGRPIRAVKRSRRR